MQMQIRNARKIACEKFFPPTARTVRIRISDIGPPHSAVLIYTPKTVDMPVRFDSPDTTAEVPVSGYVMYAQPVLGNKSYRLEFLSSNIDP
jgi:hypothetical protein